MKLPQFMVIHGTSVFQQDEALRLKTKKVKDWPKSAKTELLRPDKKIPPNLNPIENVWFIMK